MLNVSQNKIVQINKEHKLIIKMLKLTIVVLFSHKSQP